MADKQKQFTYDVSLSTKDTIALLSNISTMLSAGISILETIDSLLEDAKGAQQKLLTVIRADLIQGKHLYASFARFPNIFDDVSVNIIKASEEAGSLDATLKDLKNNMQKDLEFLDKVKSAMVYPIIIFVVFIGVMLMLLIFVIPKMAAVFVRMKGELPLPTKVIIGISTFITTKWLYLIFGLVIGGILLYYVLTNKRKWLMGVLYSTPGITELVKQIDITRFTRSMGILLSSGLTITSALELCEKIVWRQDVANMIRHTRSTVMSGKRISDGLRDYRGIMPSILIKIIDAGEKTGTLEKSLSEISEHMDYEVSKTLSSLITLIEPIMLVVIGAMVGGIMLSIIAPIYTIIGQVGNK